ncbi:SdpI family protein [Idiomarina sp. HP20-50]|uniref:SdpI family protein n=1 Tax=Idiomarina sp. HP20-50 TaxID=3070813 RepID=UPI00294ADE75|nr:SdpI family protein [Idiomarina sp. HP20-50]MDV6315304.1 SdpI family protein [Idiomarina sp. HP20-50]
MKNNQQSAKIPAKYRWITALMIVFISTVGLWFYPELPEKIPTHWNFQGKVDGWINKPWGVFLMPLVMLATWLLMEVLSFISPKGYKLNDFIGVVGLLMVIIVGFLLVVGIAQLAFALGYPVDFAEVITAAVGLLLIFTGNYLGKVKKNFFIGIRTPWTIANEEVWNRTHRLAGWLFVIAGVTICIGALFGAGVQLMLPVILVAALIPAAYSLWLYKKLEG